MKRLKLVLDLPDDMADTWMEYLRRRQEYANAHPNICVRAGISCDARGIKSFTIVETDGGEHTALDKAGNEPESAHMPGLDHDLFKCRHAACMAVVRAYGTGPSGLAEHITPSSTAEGVTPS